MAQIVSLIWLFISTLPPTLCLFIPPSSQVPAGCLSKGHYPRMEAGRKGDGSGMCHYFSVCVFISEWENVFVTVCENEAVWMLQCFVLSVCTHAWCPAAICVFVRVLHVFFFPYSYPSPHLIHLQLTQSFWSRQEKQTSHTVYSNTFCVPQSVITNMKYIFLYIAFPCWNRIWIISEEIQRGDVCVSETQCWDWMWRLQVCSLTDWCDSEFSVWLVRTKFDIRQYDIQKCCLLQAWNQH